MASVTALIAGMNVYATQQGNREEILELPQDTGSTEGNNVITEALVNTKRKASGQTGRDFPNVPVVTWEEYKKLSDPDYVVNENAGTELEPAEGQLTREEAARIGMNEVYRVLGENMDGMKAVIMWLEKAEGKQKADVWSGYVVNFLRDGLADRNGKTRSYLFDIDAVTGEILGVSMPDIVDHLDEANRLSDQELVAKAEELALKYQLVDPEDDFQKNSAGEDKRVVDERKGALLYLTSAGRNVIFRNDGYILKLMFSELNETFLGYQYDDIPF